MTNTKVWSTGKSDHAGEKGMTIAAILCLKVCRADKSKQATITSLG